jgi:hypothetical protein
VGTETHNQSVGLDETTFQKKKKGLNETPDLEVKRGQLITDVRLYIYIQNDIVS